MNIVDLLKDQLSGQVAKQIGGAVGVNEADLSKVIGAGLPGLLGGLGKLASSNQGAGKLADAIGGIDSGLLGNLAGMVTGGMGKQGGDLLGNLFGGTAIDGIASAISKLTGVNAGIIKTVLGYIAPIVLGSIGSTFQGGKPSASGLTKLFDEQKSNITKAMPAGFSLDNIPGFQSLAGIGSPVATHASAPAGSTSGKVIAPAMLIAAIGGLIYYVTGQLPKTTDRPAAPTTDVMTPQVSAPQVVVPAIVLPETPQEPSVDLPSVDLSKMAAELPKFDIDGMKSSMTTILDGLASKLSGATDATSADAMLPDLSGYADQIGTMSESMKVLPEQGKSMISGLIKSQLDKLDPIFEQFTSIPGIGDSVKAVIEKIKTALLQIAG